MFTDTHVFHISLVRRNDRVNGSSLLFCPIGARTLNLSGLSVGYPGINDHHMGKNQDANWGRDVTYMGPYFRNAHQVHIIRCALKD